MARCHLSRQLSLLTGKLGNQGHFPLVRSSVVARQGLSNFIAKNYTTGSSSLSKQFMLKPVPQLHQMLRPISTSQSHKAAVTGDHVRLWQAERIGSVILIGLLPACVLFDSPIIDASLAVIMVMHSHWGLEAIVLDYARPIVVGNLVPKLAHFALNVFSAVTLAGLLFLIYNGPGIGKTVKSLWTVGSEESSVKSVNK